MPPPRNWTSPPTRREISLVLFALTLFVLTYNIETSLRIVGVSPKLSPLSTLPSSLSSSLSSLGFGSNDPGLDADGRRPIEWRDDLERIIVGDWEWNEGEIASVEHAQDRLVLVELGEKVEASTYVYKAGAGKTFTKAGSAQAHTLGEVEAVGVDVGPREGVQLKGGFVWWGEKGRNIEQSRVLVHVPGTCTRIPVFSFLFIALRRNGLISIPI